MTPFKKAQILVLAVLVGCTNNAGTNNKQIAEPIKKDSVTKAGANPMKIVLVAKKVHAAAIKRADSAYSVLDDSNFIDWNIPGVLWRDTILPKRQLVDMNFPFIADCMARILKDSLIKAFQIKTALLDTICDTCDEGSSGLDTDAYVSVLGKRLPIEEDMEISKLFHFTYGKREYIAIFMLPRMYANMWDPHRGYLFDVTNRKKVLAFELPMTGSPEETFHDVDNDGVLDYITLFPYNEKQVSAYTIKHGKLVEKKGYKIILEEAGLCPGGCYYINLRKSKWFYPLTSLPIEKLKSAYYPNYKSIKK